MAAREANVVPSTFVATSCVMSSTRRAVKLPDDQVGGSIDPGVDPTEAGDGRVDDAVDVIGNGDIGNHAERVAAELATLLDHELHFVAVSRGHHEMGAAGRE